MYKPYEGHILYIYMQIYLFKFCQNMYRYPVGNFLTFYVCVRQSRQVTIKSCRRQNREHKYHLGPRKKLRDEKIELGAAKSKTLIGENHEEIGFSMSDFGTASF